MERERRSGAVVGRVASAESLANWHRAAPSGTKHAT